MIGRGGEEELVVRRGRRVVITGAVEAQRPLKVQELAHEVEVRGDVRLFPLDEVVSVVEREVELLHQVGHGDGDRAADAGQAVDQDAALLGTGLICGEGKTEVMMVMRLFNSTISHFQLLHIICCF